MFAKALAARRQDPCYWRPPEGESLADVYVRIGLALDRVGERSPDGTCVLVTHEDVMWAARLLLEGLSQEQWRALLLSDDPCDKIHNGQVLQYSRRDPDSDRCSDSFHWMRSVCPWDPARSANEWRRIRPRTFTNEELLATVERIGRLVPGRGVGLPART